MMKRRQEEEEKVLKEEEEKNRRRKESKWKCREGFSVAALDMRACNHDHQRLDPQKLT